MLKMVLSKKTGFFITLSIGLIVLSTVYTKVFFSPNQYMFNKTDDGNYFIYAWHIKHDSSFFHFDGISYPYGESISMDTLHVFSSFMKVLSFIFPSTERYAIGVLNFFILISICLGAAFIYLILVRFHVPILISAIASNGIAFLSSQVLLLSPYGHYGLTFICFFPMAWYFLIVYYSKPSIWISSIICLNTIFWTFSHVYLGFIISFFTFLCLVNWLILQRKLPQKVWEFMLCIFVQLIIPLLVFLLIHLSSNSHPNRIDMPFMTEHTNTFSSIFFPVFSTFQAVFFWVQKIAFETNQWSRIGIYLGLTTNIILLFFLFKIMLSIYKRNFKSLKSYFSQNFDIFLISAIILLLYSMAIPIKYIPEDVINKLPIIRQFSSLGRFGWSFYYVINIFSIVFIYKLTCNHKRWRYLPYIVAILLFIEGLQIHITQSERISRYTNLYLEENLSESQKLVTQIEKNQFQAILPLPYYFKFAVPIKAQGTNNSILYSQLTAYYTGLPIMSTYLSRPSVTETMSIYRQFLPFPFQTTLNKVIKDGRDILIITCHADSAMYNANEKLIMQKSKLITSNNKISILRLSLDNLYRNNNESHVNSFKQNADKLYSKNKLLVNDTSYFFIYKDYEHKNSDIKYDGNGAFRGTKNQYNILCDTPTYVFDTALQYRLSLWYYNYVWDQTFATLVINEKDSCGNDLLYDYYSPIKGETIDGWWYLSERVFKIKSKNGRLKIFTHGRNLFKNEIYVDQLLLKPECLNTYQINYSAINTTIIKNNKKFCIKNNVD